MSLTSSCYLYFIPPDNFIWDPTPELDVDKVWTKLSYRNGIAGKDLNETLCIPIIQHYLSVHNITFLHSNLNPMKLAVPRGVVSPYSTDNTVHMYSAFWSLFLPKTVIKHASAIWRSYISQSLFYLIPDTCLMYVYPGSNSAMQIDETDGFLYARSVNPVNSKKSLEAVRMLKYLSASFDHFEQAMIYAYELLLNQSIIDAENLEYIITWIMDLKSIGYQFPKLPIKSNLWTREVQLCIMFNWGTTDTSLRILLAYYRSFFNSIVLLYDGEWPDGAAGYTPEGVLSIQVDTKHGWYQQRALYECLKIGQRRGLSTLYISDDMFINISMLSTKSLSKVWYMKAMYVDFRNEREVFADHWYWWTKTGTNFYGKLQKVISSLPDKWMEKWKVSGYPQKVCVHSIADTIYVPLTFANDMLELLRHIMSVEPELFCEIVYPILIDIVVPESHKEPYLEGNLWSEDRYNLKLIMDYSVTRDFVHSLKLQESYGRYLWCTFMNQVLKKHFLNIEVK